MKRLVPSLAIAALLIGAAGLGGCRSNRARQAQRAAAPPPAATAPSYAMPAPSYGGSAYGGSGYAAAPGGSTSAWGSPDDGVVVSRVPVPPPTMPGPAASGTLMSAPGMGAPGAAPGGASAAQLEAVQRSQEEADQRLADLRDSVDRLVREMQPETYAPAVAGVPPEGGPSAGEMRAVRFADDLRTRTRGGEIAQNGNTVIIRLCDAFDPGRETIKTDPAIRTVLLASANALAGEGGAQIKVVGHSDGDQIDKSRGRWRDNVHLSTERANTVAHFLAQNGVPASRIAVDGRGSVEPLVFPERTKADKARNRRVEIHVIF